MTTEEQKEKNEFIAHLGIVEKELISEISESGNQKLMDLFLDFQETRNKINTITICQLSKSFEKSLSISATESIDNGSVNCTCEYPIPQSTMSDTCQTCHKPIVK